MGSRKDNPQDGLENNPGKDGSLFSQEHPYYPDGCLSCPFAGNRLVALFHDLAHRQNCHQCQRVNRVIQTANRQQKQNTIHNIYETWTNNHLPRVREDGCEVFQKQVTTASGDTVKVRKKFFNETFAKNIRNRELAKVIRLAIEFEQWMPRMQHVRTEAGIHHPCDFRVYTVEHKGNTLEVKAKVVAQGTLVYTMCII